MTRFGTFWSGTLSPYETSCLASFIKNGYEVVLYSFEEIRDLPDDVQRADARKIVDRSYLDRFITNRATNVAAFSSYFRYLMFLKTDLCWTDTDIFMLQGCSMGGRAKFYWKNIQEKVAGNSWIVKTAGRIYADPLSLLQNSSTE